MEAKDIIKNDKCQVDKLIGNITRTGKWWEGNKNVKPNAKVTLSSQDVDFVITFFEEVLFSELELKEGDVIELTNVYYQYKEYNGKEYHNISLGKYDERSKIRKLEK